MIDDLGISRDCIRVHTDPWSSDWTPDSLVTYNSNRIIEVCLGGITLVKYMTRTNTLECRIFKGDGALRIAYIEPSDIEKTSRVIMESLMSVRNA